MSLMTFDQVAAHYAANPNATLWLVPSSSTRDAIISAGHARGQTWFPNIFTIPELAERLGGGRQVHSRWHLINSLRAIKNRAGWNYYQPVCDRPGFLASCIGMLDEFTAANVTVKQAKQLFRNKSNSRHADLWHVVDTCLHADDTVWANFTAAEEAVAESLPPPFAHIETIYVHLDQSLSPAEVQLQQALSHRVVLNHYQCLEPTQPKCLQQIHTNIFADQPVGVDDTSAVHLIKAPGLIGEARLIARRIVSQFKQGTLPEQIVITARDIGGLADVLTDVFADYRIPFAHEAFPKLATNPAVRTLLWAGQIQANGFRFADVTALLRNNYFRPNWKSAQDDIPRHAETLFRQLGEVGGREAYLKATDIWSHSPPEPLEDETAEESRRQRKIRLAQRCQPFVTELFTQWDDLPAAASSKAYSTWLRSFADRVGITAVARERLEDQQAMSALWGALSTWNVKKLTADEFWHGLTLFAGQMEMSKSLPFRGMVRLLKPESAIHIPCQVLYIADLGEQSFPNTNPPQSLLDDMDRTALQPSGATVSLTDLRLQNEQRLFRRLIGQPTVELVLSYQAVDEKGQDLLPGAFLRQLLELCRDQPIPTTQQRMLIERYLTQPAMSDAEYRVQIASRFRRQRNDGPALLSHLPAEQRQHLQAAMTMNVARFEDESHNEFTGLFTDETIQQQLRDRLGPDNVFSPTALETYISCPFRFWLQHLLGLEELAEPSEEIEHTRRGSAYHRALSRLHTQLQSQPELTRQAVPETVNGHMVRQLVAAIREYADRAPSKVSAELWQLEGERLSRSAEQYQDQWNEYLSHWHQQQLSLVPTYLEKDFGFEDSATALTLEVGDVRVKLGGRIDRVDLAELPDGTLGFWIIDYKTGKKSSYTATDFQSLRKLQLPLYALAVERMFGNDRPARPLGVAYWLVTDGGAKTMLPAGRGKPTSWFKDASQWEQFKKILQEWVITVIQKIRQAEYPLAPRDKNCTETCPYNQICRITQSRHIQKDWHLELPMTTEPKQPTE